LERRSFGRRLFGRQAFGYQAFDLEMPPSAFAVMTTDQTADKPVGSSAVVGTVPERHLVPTSRMHQDIGQMLS